MNESQHLDPAALQRLQRLGGDAFVCKMIDLFLDYAAKKIGEARAAHVAGNLAGVGDAVHPLKSSAGNLGACQIMELALRLEDLAGQGQAEAVAKSLAELELAFTAVKPDLEDKRRALSARTS
jgi:HPt (histidine-containing phosphotransfer) domain-containing protein